MGLFLPSDATFKRLAWTDFITRTVSAPPAGTTAEGAQTAVTMSLQPNNFHFRRAAFLKPPNFKMAEDPNVTVTLNTARMWVASWVFSNSAAFQASLLNHEQGHYDITMMNSKDVFFELQDINGRAFASAQAGTAALTAMQRNLFNAQAIHVKYDRDTGGGVNAAMQAAWDNALAAARTTFVHPSLRTALRNVGLFP